MDRYLNPNWIARLVKNLSDNMGNPYDLESLLINFHITNFRKCKFGFSVLFRKKCGRNIGVLCWAEVARI